MKSLSEIEDMLVHELQKVRHNKLVIENECYDVSTLGDTSFLLGGILEAHLRNDPTWTAGRWIDDVSISKLVFTENSVAIWGVVIWGVHNITSEWTEPLYGKLVMNDSWSQLLGYELLFGDKSNSELRYEDYARERGYWDRNYYSDTYWNPKERNWKFVVNASKN